MIILDAKALMHHSFHIGEDPDSYISELGNEVKTAIYGFNQFMERYMLPILEDYSPQEILIAHDSGYEYRKALFPEYKQTRSRVDQDPEEREQQQVLLNAMKKFWASIGCTQARVEGVEADDLIAYFCEKLDEPIIVYTVDADLLQLQGQYDNVQVLLKCEHTEGDTYKGIPLNMTSLSKSMIGDSSDNYKGVPGFGPAKWDSLVNDFGYDGIEELEACVASNDYTILREALEESPGHTALTLLYENRAEWRKCYKLAQLHPELCWKPRSQRLVNIEWYKRVPSTAQVSSLLKAMGCADLVDAHQITQWLPYQSLLGPEDLDEETYQEFAYACSQSPVVSLDYETSPSDNAMLTDPKGGDYVDVKEALITGASFTFGRNLEQTIYLPVDHKDSNNVRVEVIGKLIKIAQDNSTLVVQNSFFETAVTRTNLDFWLDSHYDTAIMSSYVDENEEAGLKKMSKRELNYTQVSYKDVVTDPETGEERTMRELTAEEAFEYGCDDAIVTAHIFILYRLRMRLQGEWEFYKENQTSSVFSLVDDYLSGAEIDWDALQAQREADEKAIYENYVTLRGLLEEHCQQPNERAAIEFAKSDKNFIWLNAESKEREKLSKEGVSPRDKVGLERLKAAGDAAWGKFKNEAISGSVYVPYAEQVEEREFLPTDTQLKAITGKLGFPAVLESSTIKGIKAWLAEVRGIDMEDPAGSAPELSKEQLRFCELLADCVSQIKKRGGEEYLAFIRFCGNHNPQEPKITTVGDELNTGSPKQMQQLLYCKLGLPVRLKNLPQRGSARDLLSVDGSPQTDSLAIDTAMAEDAPEGDWRREALIALKTIKEAKTRISLYHDPYPLWKHPTDGRIHPQIRDCGTVTRRPAGTSPNVLQVSKHQQDGVMRSIYIPQDSESLIVSIDFSQQELRIMASESGDAELISCYIGDDRQDVHSKTASGIAKVSYSEYLEAYVDKAHPSHKKFADIRKRPAKQTNFLFAYLGEANTLSQRLIIPYEEADEMLEAAYRTYPDVRPWQEDVIKFARTHGYTQTAYGNRRHLNDSIFSKENSVRRRMERQAVNHVIQGCAADILKIVLTQCWKTNLWRDTGATLIGPVYDEITSSVPIRTIVEYINRLVEIMEVTPPGHKVPMEADVSLGRNWRDQIEIGVRPSEEAILKAVEEATREQ